MEVFIGFQGGGQVGYKEAESVIPPSGTFQWWTVQWENEDGYDKKAFYNSEVVRSVIIREETVKEDGTISQD